MAASICHTCKKAARQHCGRCCKVYYCSKGCQILDWEEHKSDCKLVQALQMLDAYNLPCKDKILYVDSTKARMMEPADFFRELDAKHNAPRKAMEFTGHLSDETPNPVVPCPLASHSERGATGPGPCPTGHPGVMGSTGAPGMSGALERRMKIIPYHSAHADFDGDIMNINTSHPPRRRRRYRSP